MTQVNSVPLSAKAPEDPVGEVSRSGTESTASIPILRDDSRHWRIYPCHGQKADTEIYPCDGQKAGQTKINEPPCEHTAYLASLPFSGLGHLGN